jgi:hypothetical protein
MLRTVWREQFTTAWPDVLIHFPFPWQYKDRVEGRTGNSPGFN